MRVIRFATLCLLPLAAALPGCGRSAAPRADMAAVEQLRAGAGSKAVGPGGGEVVVEKGEGWGDVSGRFVLAGSAPQPARLPITKDLQYCGRFGLTAEGLVVGSGGGLAHVVIGLRARGKDIRIHESYTAAAGDAVVLDNKNCRFEPHVTVMQSGQLLQIKNSDPVGHNTNVTSPRLSFNENLPASDMIEKQIGRPLGAPADVSCSIHPWMKGYLVVRDHPYIATTDKEGRFTLKNVPAGVELEFEVWHESGAGSGGGLAATAGNITVGSNGRFKFTVKKDQPNDLGQFTVQPGALRGT